jgi:hypothetical protein
MMVENPERVFFKINTDIGPCVNAIYTADSGTITDNSGQRTIIIIVMPEADRSK